MLVRLDDVIALDPSGVVMLMGTNDLSRSATPEMVAGNVKEIIAKLKEHNEKMPIVLCAIMPSSASKDRPKEKIIAANKLLHEAVKDDSQVTYFDTYELFADENGDAPEAEFPDLLHPNKAGYAKWAEALRPVLVERGFAAVAEEPPVKKLK
jgi:lysophospholipase L1-like esterase